MTDTSSKPPNGAQDRLMATVSHELRTPLNGIIGMTSLLDQTDLDANQESYVRTIRRSAGQLLDMLNNVLDFARLSEGRLELSVSSVNPGDLAQDVCELMASRAHGKGIDLAVSVAPDAPCEIETDGTRLRQILFNLVGNAIKFTEKGGVLIDIRHSGPCLDLSVIDTGPGIDTDAHGKLFEAFGQARQEDAAKDSGVGLGLAISKTLVEAMGGAITLQSNPGHGSRFSISLPRTEASDKGVTPTPTGPHTSEAVALIGFSPATLLGLSSAIMKAGRKPHTFPTVKDIPDRMPLIADVGLAVDALDRLFASHPTTVVLRPEDRALIPELRLRGCEGYLVRPVRPASLLGRLEAMERGERARDDDERVRGVRGNGRRVLLAEDNAVNALIARRALEKAGFHVTVASTGRDALDLVEQSEFQLVLMDLRMPVMNGFDAMQHISASRPDLPLVAVSAEIDPDIERRARAFGACGVAQKPLETETLLRIADRWTRKGEAAA